MSQRNYVFSYEKGAWMEACGAKTLGYRSGEFGDVVLTLWASGMVTIMRETEKGVQPVSISPECLGKIDELRGQFGPGEVSLATSGGDFQGESERTFTHPDGGTITTKTKWVKEPGPSKRKKK